MTRLLVLALLLVPGLPARAQEPVDSVALEHSVRQLRTSVGHWEVTTDFLNDDGSVARSVEGTYRFSWVVPDRVVAGTSEIPELGQRRWCDVETRESPALSACRRSYGLSVPRSSCRGSLSVAANYRRR